METSAASRCHWTEVVFHWRRKWSYQDVFETHVLPSPFPFSQWCVTQLCHFCLSYNNSDTVTGFLPWTKPTPEPSWSLAGVGFIAWWRPREMFQLQTAHSKWARRGGESCQSCYTRGFKPAATFLRHTLPFESLREFFHQKKDSWFTVFLLIRCFV